MSHTSGTLSIELRKPREQLIFTTHPRGQSNHTICNHCNLQFILKLNQENHIIKFLFHSMHSEYISSISAKLNFLLEKNNKTKKTPKNKHETVLLQVVYKTKLTESETWAFFDIFSLLLQHQPKTHPAQRNFRYYTLHIEIEEVGIGIEYTIWYVFNKSTR